MSDTKEQLQSNVEYIAERIEKLAEGWRYCNECGKSVKKEKHCGKETEDLYAYLSDNLGIELTTDLEGALLGANITVAWGGPNIYINTKSSYVEGYWGLDQYRVKLSEKALSRIDEEIENMRY